MATKLMLVALAVLAVVALTGCEEGAWQDSSTPLQNVERGMITNAVPAQTEPTQPSLLEQIQHDFAAGAANVASNGQSAQPAQTYSQLNTGETVRAFNNSICLKSEAQHTGKVYICPQSRDLCARTGGSIVVDEYGFAKCVKP